MERSKQLGVGVGVGADSDQSKSGKKYLTPELSANCRVPGLQVFWQSMSPILGQVFWGCSLFESPNWTTFWGEWTHVSKGKVHHSNVAAASSGLTVFETYGCIHVLGHDNIYIRKMCILEWNISTPFNIGSRVSLAGYVQKINLNF